MPLARVESYNRRVLAALVSLALCQTGDPLDAFDEFSMRSRMLRVIELDSDLHTGSAPLPPRQVLLRRLLDPEQRNEAWANLNFGQSNRREHWDRTQDLFHVNHVMLTRGRDGRPVYIVFSDDLLDPSFGPGTPRGHFEVLTDEPGFRPVFLGANIVNDSSRVFDFTGAGDLAVALVVTHATRKGNVQALYVVPLAEPSKPLLAIILGPPTLSRRSRPAMMRKDLVECDGDGCTSWDPGSHCDAAYAWTWFLAAQRSGPPRIDIGPPAVMEPVASYRWNRATNRYEGPRSIAGQPFLVLPLDAKAVQAAAERFAASTPPEGPAGDPSCH